MAEKTTFIKVDRNILNWGWYKDTNTKVVFLHLLLTANVKPRMFLGVPIQRGEVATSQNSLAENLGISIKAVRTALKHLEQGGEVAVRRHPRFSVISILRYDYYQAKGQAEGRSKGSQGAGEGQQIKNIRIKEEKNNLNTATKVSADLEDYGGLFLSASQWDEIEQAVGPGVLIEYVDKVAEWLQENPRQKRTHYNILKKFLRNDGLIK